jgi:predicted dehydrogenase
MLSISVLGLGGMGRTHFGCYRKNPDARVVAICSSDERKLSGAWDAQALNVGASEAARVDLSGVATFRDWHDAIALPEVQLVDICLPTPLHAPVAIAALEAGKHVVCEKPIALTKEDAQRMADAAHANNRQLFVGHCLRFWPQYVAAHTIIANGEYGAPVYARFHRSSAMPSWSAGGWLLDAAQSGGALLDMHIHDIDVALWYFGEPADVGTDGSCAATCPPT